MLILSKEVIIINNILDNNNFSLIKNSLKKNSNLMLFLDYDGTLAYFNKDPKKAHPVSGVKETIKQLTKFNSVKIAIISGRNLNDLKNMINLNNIYYAGLHGLEMKDYNSKKLKKHP